MALRILVVLSLAAVALAVFFRPAPRSPGVGDGPQSLPAEDLVAALERGEAGACERLLAHGPEGMRALEARLTDSSRGILELLPREEDPRDRLIAALAAFGPAAEPPLVRLLDALPAKAPRIAAALESLCARSEAAIAGLLARLGQPCDEIASALVKAGPAAIPGLREALLDGERCEGAARALGALGATAELRAALAPGAPPASRAAAARALGDARDALAADALLALLADGEEDDDVAQAAAGALCAIGAEGPLLERTQALFDKGPVFDGAADRKAVPFLLRAAADADEDIRTRAFDALAGLGPLPAEAVPLAKAALAGGARRAAAAALGEGCADAEVPSLLAALAAEDADPYVRIAAGEACWRLGGDPAQVIPVLVAELPLKSHLHRLLGHTGRNAASKALGRMGGAAVPALVEALDTEDDFARAQAAAALLDIGSAAHAGEARLRELAASDRAGVREAAQGILDRLARLPGGT